MNIELVKLNKEHQPLLNDMLEEWYKVEEVTSPCAIFKNDYKDFDNYIKHLDEDEFGNERVANSVYFCLDKDRNIFVGAIDIRHKLNDYLLFEGGHIGTGIRPSERRKGYATKMIHLGLEKCKEFGINKVLITCADDNIGSYKSIENNGGVLENKVVDAKGICMRRYWIDLMER